MAIDFPASPTTGQSFTDATSGDTWIFDGAKWVLQGGGTASKIQLGNTSVQVVDTGSDGEIRLTTEGTRAVTVDSSQRVGIGNSSPGSFFSGANQLVIGDGAGGKGISLYSSSTANGYLAFNDTGNTTSQGWIGYEHAANALTLASNEVERVRIDASGNFGIGTSPATRLHVKEVGADCELRLNSGTGYVSRIGAEGSNTLAFDTGYAERARIDGSGRLLVGTSTARSSTGAIQVETAGTTDRSRYEAFTNINSSAGTHITLGKSRGTTAGSNTIVAASDEIGALNFHATDGSTDLRAAQIKAVVDGTPGSNDMPGRLVFSTTADGASSPTERMKINYLGELFVYDVYNSTTASAANVFVGSSGRIVRSTSSGKYKTNVETLEDYYADALLKCRPVWYRSTCEGDNPEHGWWGFIAEEVAAIDPRLVHWKTVEVTYDENGSAVETPCDPEPEGVQYDRFVPHLLNLIKRQGEAIADLQAEVAALKGA